MRTYARLPLVVAIIFVFAGISYAQSKSCVVTPPSPFRHNAQIVTRLDPKTRQVKAIMQHPMSLSRSGDPVYLSAEFAYTDRRFGAKPTIDIAFTSLSKSPRFEYSHSLTLLIDGQPWPVASPVQYSSKKQDKGFVLETTKVTLTYDSLISLIQGRRVAGQLGMMKFELSNNHLEALREIANMMMPGNRVQPGGRVK